MVGAPCPKLKEESWVEVKNKKAIESKERLLKN